MRLKGKVAIVTGAASGIGAAVVRKYLAYGAAGVVAVDRSDALATALGSELAEHGDRLALIQGDVATENTAQTFTDAALRRFSRIDVIVNNAAVSIVKSVIEHTPEEWDFVMNVNVKAIYWSSRSVIPTMKKQGGGVILNTGSISSLIGIPTQGAYAPSKGAIVQMTRQMAIEFARFNVRVNAICPGTVDTPLVHQSAQASGDASGYMRRLEEGHPLGRIATSAEIAEFYAFYASDAAAFATGSLVVVDGGYTAR